MVNAEAVRDLRARLMARAREEGFAVIGFASAQQDPKRSSRLDHWIEAGHHGDMEWMAARQEQRGSPQALWDKAQSVIALGMSYAPAHDPFALAQDTEHARISVYAQGRDYHTRLKKSLKSLARWLVGEAPESELKVFVDTAPVMEKPLGEAAGIGWQGKHTNLVSTDAGNWLFLGAIYSSLPFEPDAPHPDRCGSCNACQVVCPTDAFPSPYQLDARRCISYLTIEHKGAIPHEFRKALGNRIYGCDDCLAVCPWNTFAKAAQCHRDFLPRAELAAPRLADLLELDDQGFRALFSGSAIKRIGRNRFVRNCLIAAGNSANRALLAQVEKLRSDPDPVVAEAADWAFGELRSVI